MPEPLYLAYSRTERPQQARRRQVVLVTVVLLVMSMGVGLLTWGMVQ